MSWSRDDDAATWVFDIDRARDRAPNLAVAEAFERALHAIGTFGRICRVEVSDEIEELVEVSGVDAACRHAREEPSTWMLLATFDVPMTHAGTELVIPQAAALTAGAAVGDEHVKVSLALEVDAFARQTIDGGDNRLDAAANAPRLESVLRNLEASLAPRAMWWYSDHGSYQLCRYGYATTGELTNPPA